MENWIVALSKLYLELLSQSANGMIDTRVWTVCSDLTSAILVSLTQERLFEMVFSLYFFIYQMEMLLCSL